MNCGWKGRVLIINESQNQRDQQLLNLVEKVGEEERQNDRGNRSWEQKIVPEWTQILTDPLWKTRNLYSSKMTHYIYHTISILLISFACDIIIKQKYIININLYMHFIHLYKVNALLWQNEQQTID